MKPLFLGGGYVRGLVDQPSSNQTTIWAGHISYWLNWLKKKRTPKIVRIPRVEFVRSCKKHVCSSINAGLLECCGSVVVVVAAMKCEKSESLTKFCS